MTTQVKCQELVIDTEKPRRKRGRPPSPQAERRGHRVVTFVTDAEMQALLRLARREQDTLSSTLHRLIKTGLS